MKTEETLRLGVRIARGFPGSRLRFAAILAAVCGLASSAMAQPIATVFTYQGELKYLGAPATAAVDVRFTLYRPGGVPVPGAPVLCAEGVVPVDGRITVQLDFGAQFTGEDRFVGIEARNHVPGVACTAGGPFTSLAGRQRLTATPYALTANAAGTANNAANLNGQPASFYRNASNLNAGIVPDAQLAPSVARTGVSQTFTGSNVFTGLTTITNGTFTGNGAGLGALNASSITTGFLDNARLGPNVPLKNAEDNIFTGLTNTFVNVKASGWIGSDLHPVELRANGVRALRLERTSGAPNVIGGDSSTTVIAGATGVTIAGGGPSNLADVANTNNRALDIFGTIGGGGGNRVGDGVGTLSDSGYATIGGGRDNRATRIYSTVGGGILNQATGNSSVVAGGGGNQATGLDSTIGGGGGNFAQGERSTIAGGQANLVTAAYGTIAGGGPANPGDPIGTRNRVTDEFGTIGGGGMNLAGSDNGVVNDAVFATVAGGNSNAATFTFATVGGGFDNAAAGFAASVFGGLGNEASADYSSVGGGNDNLAVGYASVIAGGDLNQAQAERGSIGGGRLNQVFQPYGTVGGGAANQAEGVYATVGGGEQNITGGGNHATVGGGYRNLASAPYSVVAGGSLSGASAIYAAVGGGYSNMILGSYGTIGGGASNNVFADYGTIAGGGPSDPGDPSTGNRVLSAYGAVGGGGRNVAGGANDFYRGEYATVAGGQSNKAEWGASFVGGGKENLSNGYTAAILGGSENQVLADFSSIAGGLRNQSLSPWGTIGGGYQNKVGLPAGEGLPVDFCTISGGRDNAATGNYSTVSGGGFNIASYEGATVPGGFGNQAGGYCSFAAGQNAKVRTASEVGPGDGAGDQGTFIWADSSNIAEFRSTGPNQFLIRAEGGVAINTANPAGYDLRVVGSFTATSKFFSIDHPSDPLNKILVHSTVESDEYKNVYDGIAVTGPDGYAVVQLPAWMSDLNEKFRYQLTIIDEADSGDPLMWARVVRKVDATNTFTIRTNGPGVEVSWQLTGVRKDAYARAHPIQVETEKVGAEKGAYLFPAGFESSTSVPQKDSGAISGE
jgi:hypothetical protein